MERNIDTYASKLADEKIGMVFQQLCRIFLEDLQSFCGTWNGQIY